MNKRSVFKTPRWGKSIKAGDASKAITARYDVGSALDCGMRDYQQDALVTDFPTGDDYGIAVLADGMGGHQSGEIASAIAVGEAFAELKARSILCRNDASAITETLRGAVHRANCTLGDYLANAPESRGMGTTLVVSMTVGNDLYWASVGDSLLYLYRDGQLERLNADHSMGPSIDAMVAAGLLDQDEAVNHPQRNQLLSAICGTEYKYLDCPDTPRKLEAGDIVILASDGLQTLEEPEIRDCIAHFEEASARDISKALIDLTLTAQDPEQDNVSAMVLKIEKNEATVQPVQREKPTAETKAPGTARDVKQDSEIEEASDLLNQAFFG